MELLARVGSQLRRYKRFMDRLEKKEPENSRIYQIGGKKATCYPGFEDKLTGAEYTRTGVVTDGNITTARGLGYGLDLGLELVALLDSKEKAAQIKAAIQYDQF